MTSPILDAIYKRRSIREYSDKKVTGEQLLEIIKAGSWAPSGLNNQPWRFVTIQDRTIINQMAQHTKYAHIIKAAPSLIGVFIDKNAMYNETKDHQAIGACLQNMLLATEALELGAVWLGEILNHKEQVNTTLGLNNDYELMAVLAIGHPAHKNQCSQRKDINDLIIKKL
ncbi:MAG: nitroreductase [Proteobacteria bacterium]|nr:nitroreductase [Pseudomonadota bacterium]MBU1715953.1 nitroreductase [Pseudomonadota bacterium]